MPPAQNTQASSTQDSLLGHKSHILNNRLGAEGDPFGELATKFSLLSPADMSGVGFLSSLDSKGNTPNSSTVPGNGKLQYDPITENYNNLLSEPLKNVKSNSSNSPNIQRSLNSSVNKSGHSKPMVGSHNSVSSSSSSSRRSGLSTLGENITFGTPPELEPTTSDMEKGSVLRAMDVLSMSPTKDGGTQYSLGIFDSDFVNADHGACGDHAGSGRLLQLLVDDNDPVVDNPHSHGKWQDLAQEIRNAGTVAGSNDIYGSEPTSMSSEITQDNVRVIEFKDGSFNEFTERSPLNIKDHHRRRRTRSADDSTSESSDYGRRRRESTEKRGQGTGNDTGVSNNSENTSTSETDSLIARYRKLRSSTTVSVSDDNRRTTSDTRDQCGRNQGEDEHSLGSSSFVSLELSSLGNGKTDTSKHHTEISPFGTAMNTNQTSVTRNKFTLDEFDDNVFNVDKDDTLVSSSTYRSKFTLEDFDFMVPSTPSQKRATDGRLSSVDQLLKTGPLSKTSQKIGYKSSSLAGSQHIKGKYLCVFVNLNKKISRNIFTCVYVGETS